jgi:hypothetical protein
MVFMGQQATVLCTREAPPGNQAATEKTNINLYHSENPVYSPKVCPALKHSGKGIERSEQIKARNKLLGH